MFLMCLSHLAESKRKLVCRCDRSRCKSMNYTCITEGACVVYIDRYGTEEVQVRSCTTEDPGPRMICDSHDEKPDISLDYGDYHAHCCYKNMCNDVNKINLTLPTASPSTSHTGKGNFTENTMYVVGLINFPCWAQI